MNQENINRIQDKVIKLLNSQGNGHLNALAIDCCSEMARLVGGWIQESQKQELESIVRKTLSENISKLSRKKN